MIRDVGYDFGAEAEAPWPGHRNLEVYLREEPTERHFDPEHLTFPTATGDGSLGTTTVAHPWRGLERMRTCAGHIAILDRKHKFVEAFSFGGEVRIDEADGVTRCRMTSTAPIVELLPTHHIDPDGIATWFAAEVEALLARRRAAHILDEATFAKNLASARPDELYLASLLAVRERIARRRRERRTERETYAAHILDEAIASAEAARPGTKPPPRLEDLL